MSDYLILENLFRDLQDEIHFDLFKDQMLSNLTIQMPLTIILTMESTLIQVV